MKVNILSKFFVIIAYYRYPLQTLNLIVAVIYNLSNSEILFCTDRFIVVDGFITIHLYGIRTIFDQD
ncbi:hypothetical protein BTO00_20415 [Vibrio campbellii]|nr:hypothetical protein BTO00_20415 [Vibrio campbellii]PQJ46560.1 hypothetical protein BTN99_12975 [Vibrio campbellii]